MFILWLLVVQHVKCHRVFNWSEFEEIITLGWFSGVLFINSGSSLDELFSFNLPVYVPNSDEWLEVTTEPLVFNNILVFLMFDCWTIDFFYNKDFSEFLLVFLLDLTTDSLYRYFIIMVNNIKTN